MGSGRPDPIPSSSSSPERSCNGSEFFFFLVRRWGCLSTPTPMGCDGKGDPFAITHVSLSVGHGG
ncbi:hypothetical protein Syun_000562 [Stephania yunnanensis]|uniref:Uncharacterized protein n=1 Tax=Stephania yunnanensis TaxID=152371 RepID=A0AAP0LDW9_9MAGN